MAKTQQDELLTARQVARLLDIAPETVSRWGREGRIAPVRLSSRCIRYSGRSVRALIERARREGVRDED